MATDPHRPATPSDLLNLVEAARGGDEAALDQLIEHVQPQVYRFGLKMCRHPEDAEDVLQETLLSLARAFGDFRGDASVSTWLYTVARNHCIKKRRTRVDAPTHLEPLDAAQAVADGTPDPERNAQAHESWSAVEAALAELSEDDREVVVLRDIEGLSAKEVAEIQGTSVSAVKSRLHRARVALRGRLAPRPLAPGCVDIREMFSRFLEGEIDQSTCAKMQAHVDQCPSCQRECEGLKTTLRLCRTAPAGELSPETRARVRDALGEALARRPA